MLRQSGVIPYRRIGKRVEVLLITNKAGTRWIVPKGRIEPDLTPHASAAKEAMEEAGVTGAVDPRPVGSYEYERCGERRIVELYPMAVEDTMDEWPEMEFRRRAWLSPDEAVRRVDLPGIAACIRTVSGRALMTDAA